MAFETRLTTCTKSNRGEESAAFLPTPPHVHSVTIRSPVRLSPTFARNFDLNLFKDCITRGRFSFLVSPTILFCSRLREEPGRCHASLYRCTVKFSVNRQPTPFFFSSSLSFFFFNQIFLYQNHSIEYEDPSFDYKILVCAINEIQVYSIELFSSKNNGYQDYDSFVLQMSCFIFCVVNVRIYIFFTICRQSEFNFFSKQIQGFK